MLHAGHAKLNQLAIIMLQHCVQTAKNYLQQYSLEREKIGLWSEPPKDFLLTGKSVGEEVESCQKMKNSTQIVTEQISGAIGKLSENSGGQDICTQ